MRYAEEHYPGISFIPPKDVANAAKEGLMLRAKFGRGGTIVGLHRGQELSLRKELHPQVIKRMYSYFARHEVDKRGKYFNDPVKPSNGKIAWLLWGGEPGKRWATEVRAQMLEADAQKKRRI